MSDKKNQAIFSIFFEDGTNFIGGNSYFETKWINIPKNKRIKHIFYTLPDGNVLVLKGYNKYFHMIEATKDWRRVKKTSATRISANPRIEYAYIMGEKEGIVTSYRITLFHKKDERYHIGDIVRREFYKNNPKIKGLNPDNWRG